MRSGASPLAVWAGLIVLYLVWGSTYLGIRLAVETLPPFTMSAIRFEIAGVLLVTVIAVRSRRSFRRPSRREVRDAGIVAAFLMVGGIGMVAWAEQTVPSSIAALMVGLMPMWLAIFSWTLLHERLPALAGVGIAVGLVGVAILVWPTGGVGELEPAGLAVLLLSPVMWALGSIFAARRARLPHPALFATGLQMVIGGLLLAGLAVAAGELRTVDWAAVSPTSWAGLVYLIVVGSLIGYTTYQWLLSVAPLPRIATYAYVNPVVAVILGTLLAGESFTPRTLVASVVIVVAVALIVTARGRTSPPVERVAVPPAAGDMPASTG